MKNQIKILSIIAFVVIIGAFLGVNYYRNSVQNQRVTGNSSGKSSLNPEVLVRPDSAVLGSAEASVTIVEFLDPECESCAAFGPVVKKIVSQSDGKVRLVIRYMPLHPNSVKAATLLEAAGEQGKYWQMLDILFQRQPEWGERHGPPTSTPPPDVDALFEKYAMEVGLDIKKIAEATKENRYQVKLNRDKQDGQSLGVRQTPTLFVNGRRLVRLGESDLKAMIDEELKK